VSEQLHDVVAARLASAGVRYTRHRRTLVSALADAGQPLTIPEILGAATSLPQSSVYRNLSVFEEVLLVHRIPGHGEFARFELAEDLLGHHHHLACIVCGSVTDFELPVETEHRLERSLRQVAQERGFAVTNHRLDLVGRCENCLAADGSE
jgi:Fe2+ or Zn2+ uptake regulation protein